MNYSKANLQSKTILMWSIGIVFIPAVFNYFLLSFLGKIGDEFMSDKGSVSIYYLIKHSLYTVFGIALVLLIMRFHKLNSEFSLVSNRTMNWLLFLSIANIIRVIITALLSILPSLKSMPFYGWDGRSMSIMYFVILGSIISLGTLVALASALSKVVQNIERG